MWQAVALSPLNNSLICLLMKVTSDEVRSRIVAAAQEVFGELGFREATMRVIARRAGVSAANLYNYFPNKDALFCHLVQPFIDRLESVLYEHHSPSHARRLTAFWRGEAAGLLEAQVAAYTAMLRDCRLAMELLLLRAEGSSVERYVAEFTDRCARQVQCMASATGLESAVGASFTWRVHVVWLLATLREIVVRRLPDDEAVAVLRDHVRFEYNGWRVPANSIIT